MYNIYYGVECMLQWIISIMGSDYPIIKTSSERGRERE